MGGVTTFDDGTTRTEHWNGVDRRMTYSYETRSRATSSQVDPRRILMWDGCPYFPLRKDFPLAGEILDLLETLNARLAKTIVVVTHDSQAAARAHVIRHLDKGVLTDVIEYPRAARSPAPGNTVESGPESPTVNLLREYVRTDGTRFPADDDYTGQERSDIINGTALYKPIPLPSGTPIDLTLDTSLNFDQLLQSYAEAWSNALKSAH